MRRRDGRPRPSNRGFTLTELLVAFTVLVLAMTSALVLYDGARRSFKQNENAIDQQQVVRIAFDMMATDLRLAGFNTNPDGDDARPDEQIELALDTAIVIRADFDAGRADAGTPESDLESAGSFDRVTTGNDEIVAFVLANPRSRDSLRYSADVGGNTRDGSVESVAIPSVALTHDSPPYTLYRITLDADAGVVRTPLAGNIRSMSFEYYDQAGNRITAPGGGEGVADQQSRSRIRRIRVQVEGLTRDPDSTWVDEDDPHFYSRRRRKFSLSGDITPRNLGRQGMMDLTSGLTFPAPDVTPVLVPGHCEGMLVRWPQAPAEHWSYVVSYEDSDGATGEVQGGGRDVYVPGLTHDRLHRVWLRARDPFGNLSEPTTPVSERTSNLSAPEAVANLVAAENADGDVELTWDRVENNATPIAGDPRSPRLRDFRRYQVQRKRVDDVDWTSIKTLSGTAHVDTTAEDCTRYSYRVLAQDRCFHSSDPGAEVSAMTLSTVAPQAPAHLEAFLYGTDVRLSWQAVTRNVENTEIQVAGYGVYRVVWPVGPAPEDLGLYTRIGDVSGDSDPLAFVDPSLNIPSGQAAFYRLVALDGCGNESEPSVGVAAEQCAFNGAIVFVSPEDGADSPGMTTVRLDVLGGSESYVRAELEFTNLANALTDPVIDCPTATFCDETLGAGWISWTTQWDNWSSEPHEITATVHTSAGCSVSRSIVVGPGLE